MSESLSPPPGATPPVSPAGGAAAPGGAAPGMGAGGPPMGTSPATGPTPNLGFQAKGRTLIAQAVMALGFAVPLVGPASEEGTDILAALKMLAKHTGGVTQQAQGNSLEEMLRKHQQQQPQLAQMRQQMMSAPPPMPGAQAAA